jgi:hypothetical protein
MMGCSLVVMALQVKCGCSGVLAGSWGDQPAQDTALHEGSGGK